MLGVNNFETAKWLSQMMGQETIRYQTESRKPGDMPTTGTSITGRDLLTSDEIMSLSAHLPWFGLGAVVPPAPLHG